MEKNDVIYKILIGVMKEEITITELKNVLKDNDISDSEYNSFLLNQIKFKTKKFAKPIFHTKSILDPIFIKEITKGLEERMPTYDSEKLPVYTDETKLCAKEKCIISSEDINKRLKACCKNVDEKCGTYLKDALILFIKEILEKTQKKDGNIITFSTIKDILKIYPSLK
ncbi:hypothetical protein TCON_2133 [Astathelohania contejeani]|uniref:Uncharacterized protein n=1 Tax=Astathelohania contejeani TaxID=164912 RepID=A0ABQ7HX10_9MICR|nr:hypothetical protein TCON_2133 [Thelohania contejeani]